MLNIKPISELRNYSKLLDEVKKDQPVFLTKNGYGRYAIIDLEDYDRYVLGLELLEMIDDAEKSGTMPLAAVMEEFGEYDE